MHGCGNVQLPKKHGEPKMIFLILFGAIHVSVQLIKFHINRHLLVQCILRSSPQ